MVYTYTKGRFNRAAPFLCLLCSVKGYPDAAAKIQKELQKKYI